MSIVNVPTHGDFSIERVAVSNYVSVEPVAGHAESPELQGQLCQTILRDHTKMEPQIAKGKTEFFDKLKDQLRKNGGGIVNDRGRVEIIGSQDETKYNWRQEWAQKCELDRPNDRLPRGIKPALITKPYGLMWDEFPNTAH